MHDFQKSWGRWSVVQRPRQMIAGFVSLALMTAPRRMTGSGRKTTSAVNRSFCSAATQTPVSIG